MIEPVSVLQGIKNRVGEKVKVVYAPWKSAADGLELIQGENFPEGLRPSSAFLLPYPFYLSFCMFHNQ